MWIPKSEWDETQKRVADLEKTVQGLLKIARNCSNGKTRVIRKPYSTEYQIED